jgi:hypothetical protein
LRLVARLDSPRAPRAHRRPRSETVAASRLIGSP